MDDYGNETEKVDEVATLRAELAASRKGYASTWRTLVGTMPYFNSFGLALRKWKSVEAENVALRAELDDLRRKWASVPWGAFGSVSWAAEEYEHHHHFPYEEDDLKEKIEEADAWIEAHRPKEPTK